MHVEDGVLQATAGGVLNGRLDLGALVPLVEWGDGDELKVDFNGSCKEVKERTLGRNEIAFWK